MQPRGHMLITGPLGSVEHDTYTCCHCQAVLRARPDNDICLKCMAVQCGRCAEKPCRPFEAWLQAFEAPRGVFEMLPIDAPLPQRGDVVAKLDDTASRKTLGVVWDLRFGMHLWKRLSLHEASPLVLVELPPLDAAQLEALGAARFVVVNKLAGKAVCLAFEEPAARTVTALLNLEQARIVA